MRIQKDNKAVSPVIGIMLMLVVTVILAAAVSSSSSGLMKSTEKAPFAVFDVKVARDLDPSGDSVNSYITIRQVTGDAIQTKDLKIVTTNSNATGSKTWEIKPSDDIKTHGAYNKEGLTPYWNNMGKFGFGAIGPLWTDVGNNVDVNFGNYTLKPGVVMTAQDYATDNLGTWNGTSSKYEYVGSIGQMKTMFADWDNVSKGDLVNVKLVHMPSSKVIFASDVEVI